MAPVHRLVLACTVAVGSASCAAPEVRLDPLRERGVALARPAVPAPFRGHWSVDPSDCRADPVDDSQVWITATSLNTYETNGHVVRVVMQDARRAVLTLRSEGEGTTYIARKGLTLSPDRTSLIIRDQDDTGRTIFRRCPSISKDAAR